MEGLKAIANYREVGNSLQELADLYIRVTRLCNNVKTNLSGFSQIKTGERTEYRQEIRKYADFREQMEIIRVFLRVISLKSNWEDEITDDEYNTFKSVDEFNNMSWFYLPVIIDEMIDWLNMTLEDCEEILKNQYEPGGKAFQQLQERNIGRYGMGM